MGVIGSDRAIHELDRRDDIDGVRAFAVVFVLLFHAGVPGFEFGFWGVDSFLVVSGYLITGAITRQIVEGRFALGDFWARRVRRLLPAGSVVMAATVAMAVLVGSPLLWRTLASDTAFASVYSFVAALVFTSRFMLRCFYNDERFFRLMRVWRRMFFFFFFPETSLLNDDIVRASL